MLARFAGTVDFLARVNAKALVEWISAIAFTDWPQQHSPAQNLPLRPAMVSDRSWHDFGTHTDPIVDELMALFPACTADPRLLSVVMPDQGIEPHSDSQGPRWVARVHVPLLSNSQSRFLVADTAYNLQPGNAYCVNTERVHSVENAGASPRVHLFWDVQQKAP